MTSLKARYTVGARRLATQSMGGLARSRVTPNALTASGVTLCAVASVLVYFEYKNEILFFWLGAAVSRRKRSMAGTITKAAPTAPSIQ